ncbi:TPA: Ig-like domain-containing protein, partial [Escherichia coli]|nr:Ig-like domain-containing protein [Escherichia coli]HBN0790990.1 Ig-like domain-containing protein [Escherichia coli]
MAGKAHGNGDRRGDNTICGLGDRLRRLTAGICLITQTIFPVMAAAPTHINPAHSDTAASLILPNVKTIPYTLGALESPPTVAARFGITVDELRRLNQFRTFARGFDNVRQGDEIDVPLINSNSPEARNLKAMQMERDGKDPQMQVAEMAQQSGTLLARDMDSEQAASMARGWVASSASAQATDWLSRWGTARVSLGVDEDFSLKSSSFEFLHPWYETPYNLVFSQHTLHRTDDRTQTNHGIGWRYFTSSWMSGVNMFIDHDLTRYHTRTGMGVEYWRDYLKLSGNGYLRLSNWRSAPELDNDYEARPANGWDLRAEGWLPAWPQLGGKLVYEQYYGDEVALFGKDERQNDPHAITAGLSYTPVPLISFSAEQRQGKQGENDTRIGMELTLQPGHSLQKQLDPAEVAARRSLVGSRYDLVDRNNNIVLEYRKKELVRLTLTDPLKGKPGEVKSLVSSLQTKYALKGYDIEAASLQSAGGKVAVSGKDIQVTIPPYRFTAMPETDNTYPIAVTAEDSKGNFSRREESMVVVEKPTLNLTDSTLSVDQQILLADGKSTSTLTYTARDSSGKPIPGMTLKTQVKGLQDFALSEWKDNGNGTYTQIVTAGKTSGALSLMPQFNGDDIAKTPALIAIVANTASRADSTIETGQDNYVAGKPIVVKVTLRDDNGNGVTGRKELLKQTVKVDNTKADDVSAWTEESEGIYKASYTAQLTMPGWQTKHSDAFSIAGDKDTAKIAAMQITANNAVARRDHNTVAVTVRDVHQNLLQGQNVTFTVVNGAAVFADPNGGIVTTDKDGIASVNLASDQAVNSLIKAEINGSSQSVEVSFITGDISQLTSTIKTDDVSYTAGGKIKVSVTLMDEQKNRVKGMASLLAGSSVVEVSGTDKNETGNWSEESDGVYTTTRTAKIAGDRHYATLKLSTWSSAQQSDAYAIRESGAVLAYSSIVTDKTAYTAGGAIKVTVTLKDSYENLVGGQRDAINLAIQLPNTKAESIAWNEDQKGIYTATYTALLPGTGLKAQLQMSGWANALTSNDYSISGDAASAQIVAMQVTTGNPDVLANGSDRHTVNVRVEDQFGNVLPEQTVTFTVTKGAAVFANTGQSADIRTDAHGMAEVDLSSTVADASTVEAKINQSSDSKTVNFVADVSTAQVAELVVTQDGSVADGATANTLRARVTDAFGNALAGQTVSVLASNGATTAPTVTTQPDGTVEISVTSQTAGTSVITASVNNSSQSRNVTFIADVSTAQIADLVVSQDNAVADGATANTLQVRVTDAFGNALAGQTVSVLADNGATVAPVVTTQPDGTVEISVTSQTAGSSAVTVSINSSSQSRDVTFIADVRTAQIADLVVIKDDSVADGAMANMLRARVTDVFGNALAGQTVSVMADNGAAVASTMTTKPDGTVEISVTSQTAGISVVTASINNSSQSQNVTFVADVRTAKIADLVVSQDNAVADGSTANTLRARVTDAFGNTLAGQTVSVMAGNGATVAPTVITEPDGTAEISVTSQTAGVSAVTASINNSSQSRDVTFIADVRTAQIASLEVTQDNAVADGAMANTLQVRVTDANGNTLAGQTVSVLADNGATVAPTVITGQDGTVEISVTSQTAGTSAVTASINSSTASRNVTFIADVRTAKIADLVVTRDNSVADGAMANTLRVRVTDAFGNTLAGQTVSVLADNGATTAPTVITGQDGTVEISVTSRTAGISTVTATINSSSQSQNVTFIADIRTAQIADLVVIKDGSVADGSTANMLRVRVTDAFGNVLAGQTVSVLAGNGATVASTVTTKPDGTVEISVTSQTAGISAVTASINSSSQSQNVTFVADVRTAKIADLVVIKDGSEADGSTANTLRVRVTDAFGNALNGQTVSVLADNSATVAPTVTTQPDGTVEISVTSQTAGISAVTASINNSSQSRNVTFIADVRTAQIADLVVIKDGSEADGATANTLRARVTDAFGNVLAGQTVSVLAGNGATVAPTVITGQDGTVEISVTSHTAGVSAVTATINNSSQSRNVTFVADVRTAQIADLVVTRDNSVADGAMANTLRVRVTDAFGNVLAGQTVSVLADNGATVAPTVTTQPDGTEEISVTSQTAGISAVTASINNSSQSRNVTFIADVRTAQIASLEVTQDNAVADGAMANTLQVRGTDANGNTLAGQTVSVMAGNGATVAPAVTTQPDGTVEIPVTSQTAGASAVTASINSSSQSRNVTFVADVRTAKIADLVVIKDGSVADGATANTLQARVTDAFGNALAGQTVSVLADNSATVAPAVITEPDGTVDISVTSQTAGISTVTATINNHSLSQSVMFIADVRTAQIADLVVIKDGSEADGATANTLRARVTDANGNALAGQTVSVLAGNSATVAPTVTTQPDGTVEISVTSQTAGTSTVTASINNSSQSQNVTFVPGDASRLTSTVETNKSNYTVGETITITVTLRDAFDNLVTGAASQLAADGVLTVAGTDPSETGSWVESGGVYTTTRMATIASTNQHANLQLQTWSDGVTSDRYDIQSGSPAQATSTIATDKNAYTAGDTITVAVTLKDAHGNLVEGGESLLSGDNVTVEGAVRSGGWSETAGVYTATWSAQMAGDSHHATLKLSEWGSSKQSESYSIHSGAPVQANSAIRTDKSAYIAGEPLTVTITLRDEFGNPALGLTSEVIESYIDSFAVGGATPDSMRWVEQNNGEYTIVWTAWVAEENLVASLKLKTWATEIKSSLYGIQPGAAAKNQSTIVADKTIYIAGDSITVTVVLKDAQGNFITDGVVQLNEENVQVRNADPIQGNNWVYNGNGQYQRQYMAHFAEANLNAQLKMAGWSDANYSNNYTIKPGEVSPLGSQLRIREVLVVEGADLPVSVLLVDDFGNPVDNGLDLLDDTVYLQNVEKKEGEKWRYVGDGIYERTYMAYQEGENLTSFMEIKGWRIYGQPSYTIL